MSVFPATWIARLGLATGECMIMLSSDDLIRPGTCRPIASCAQHLGPRRETGDRQAEF